MSGRCLVLLALVLPVGARAQDCGNRVRSALIMQADSAYAGAFQALARGDAPAETSDLVSAAQRAATDAGPAACGPIGRLAGNLGELAVLVAAPPPVPIGGCGPWERAPGAIPVPRPVEWRGEPELVRLIHAAVGDVALSTLVVPFDSVASRLDRLHRAVERSHSASCSAEIAADLAVRHLRLLGLYGQYVQIRSDLVRELDEAGPTPPDTTGPQLPVETPAGVAIGVTRYRGAITGLGGYAAGIGGLPDWLLLGVHVLFDDDVRSSENEYTPSHSVGGQVEGGVRVGPVAAVAGLAGFDRDEDAVVPSMTVLYFLAGGRVAGGLSLLTADGVGARLLLGF